MTGEARQHTSATHSVVENTAATAHNVLPHINRCGGHGLAFHHLTKPVTLRVHLREWRDRDTPHGAFVARHSQHTQPVIQ